MMHQINWMRVTCDQCGTTGPETGSAMETRAAAYGAGWRFPPKQTKSGNPSTTRSRDLCGTCAGTDGE